LTPEQKRRLYAEWQERQRRKKAEDQRSQPRPTPRNPDPEPPDLAPHLEAQRRRNRQKHPDIAAFVDECRRYFGDVEIVWFEEY